MAVCRTQSAVLIKLCVVPVCVATLLKTEAGSLPEGKVKVRLDSDGSLLEVDEDDVEKVILQLFTVYCTIK